MSRVPQPIVLLQAVTTATSGISVDMSNYPNDYRSYVCKVAGTGAVSATVLVKASNDSVNFFTLATFTLSGATSDADGFVSDDSWRYLRGEVSAISGTGAAVTLTVSS